MSFTRRYWTSLTGGGPAPRTAPRVRAGYGFWARYWASLTLSDLPSHPPRPSPERAFSGPLAPMMAASGNQVLTESSSPDGKVVFFLRAENLLEAVLRDAEAAPALVSVRYGSQLLVIPLFPQPFGPPTAQLRLPEFEPGTHWESSAMLPWKQDETWTAETISVSAAAAVNQTTKHSWRQVRELVSENLATVIDTALR